MTPEVDHVLFERLAHEAGHAVAARHYGLRWRINDEHDTVYLMDRSTPFIEAVIAICGGMIYGLAHNPDHSLWNNSLSTFDRPIWMALEGARQSDRYPHDDTPRGMAFKEARRVARHRAPEAADLATMWYNERIGRADAAR